MNFVICVRKLRFLSASLFITFAFSSAALADDTEIFFSSESAASDADPNVILILDNSASMRWNTDGRYVSGAGPSRISELKEAMNSYLDIAEDVNIGIVNFLDGTQDHVSRLVYPVTSINDPGAREDMKSVVNSMGTDTNTPLPGALYEAIMVLRGGSKERTTNTYTSPVTSECQSNHIVLVTDGSPFRGSVVDEVEALTGSACASVSEAGLSYIQAQSGKCGYELASWIADTDHKPEWSADVSVTVSTIGFHLDSDYVRNIASLGGGVYLDASSSDELVDAIGEAYAHQVLDADVSSVAPATSINQFNRLTQSNDLYFAMFKPNTGAVWSGNLKRYQFGYVGGHVVVLDANGDLALDEDEGYFKDSSRSFWSDVTDGGNVEMGGAAGELDSSGRLIYTHTGSIPYGGVTLTERFKSSNSSLASYMPGLSDLERRDVIDWVSGVDVKGENPGSSERMHMGDVIHSAPVTVNYGSDKLIFVGTNEGFLHAIRERDGKELYSFIPQELLGNLQTFYDNDSFENRPYGLDGDISLLHIDNNKNAVVDEDDKAILYVGMRRGGSDYYAFDISNINGPRLLWKISGGTGDFRDLAQSWSKPIPTKVFYKGSEREVVIFGGGYNPGLNDPDGAGIPAPGLGNTVFIVDANDGSLIWSAQENLRGISTDMAYSIPSDLRVIDINGDSLADRIYVGDMGGQLWRFDIKSYHSSDDSAAELVDGGVMAALGSNSEKARFYNEPDVAFMSHGGKRFLTIGLGSGWRAHPLDTDITDYFYMIRDYSPLSKPEGYGKESGSVWNPITRRDLPDVSGNITRDDSEMDDDGWRLKLISEGEKSLSRAVTINGQVVFSTYSPQPSTSACTPGSGVAFGYALDVLNGNPVLPLSGSGATDPSDLTAGDRRVLLKSSGIPPEPTAAIVSVGGEIRTSVAIGVETPLSDLAFSDLTRRTYWQDRKRGRLDPAECRATGSDC